MIGIASNVKIKPQDLVEMLREEIPQPLEITVFQSDQGPTIKIYNPQKLDEFIHYRIRGDTIEGPDPEEYNGTSPLDIAVQNISERLSLEVSDYPSPTKIIYL